jgi:hypothetical protein
VVADRPTREPDEDRPKGCQHDRHIMFLMVEVAVSRLMFKEILMLISQPRVSAPPHRQSTPSANSLADSTGIFLLGERL